MLKMLLPAGSGAFVMGTGIVSVGLAIDGSETVSRVLLAVAAAGWLAAAGAAVLGALGGHRSPVSLTGVAGTAVLGARAALLGWGRLAGVLLVLAAALWLAAMPAQLRPSRERVAGSSFLVVVATEALAVLAALVATSDGKPWLVRAALVPLALGLAVYPFVAARFDLRELAAGHGDQWIAGGALAIAAVACAEIGAAARPLHALGAVRPVLDDGALAIWAAAIILLPVLVAGEALRPWRGYHARRWATVFPVGMYAVCSFLVAGLDHVGAIGDFARVWVWIAFGVWAVACTGLAGRGLAALGHYDLRR